MKSRELFPAKQNRSSDTLRRIIEAAEALLEERDLHEVTMQDIATRAQRSVGTVYARIPSKDVLLAHLFDGFADRSEAGIIDLTERGRYEHWGLKRRTEEVCRWIVNRYTAERGLVRSLAHCLFYESPPMSDAFQKKMTIHSRELVRFLAEEKTSMAHNNPTRACEFAFMAALALAQNRIVFGSVSSIRLEFPAESLIQEMTRMMHAYLTVVP